MSNYRYYNYNRRSQQLQLQSVNDYQNDNGYYVERRKYVERRRQGNRYYDNDYYQQKPAYYRKPRYHKKRYNGNNGYYQQRQYNNSDGQRYYNNGYNHSQYGDDHEYDDGYAGYGGHGGYDEYYYDHDDEGYDEEYDGEYYEEPEVPPLQLENQRDSDDESVSTINTLDVRAKEAKNINNWNKYVNLTNSIKKSFLDNNNTKIDILEIGCGNANNLSTYKENERYIKNYIGIDVSPQYKMTINASFDIEYICHDIFSSDDNNIINNPLLKNIMLENNKFDLINIDLSMLHNAFKSQSTLSTFLNLIAKLTKINSMLTCSFVRDDIIFNRFNDLLGKTNIFNIISILSSDNINDDSSDNIIFQNRYQSISMKKADFNIIKDIFNDNNTSNDGIIGIPYIYYQMHSLDNIKEYFIYFEYLKQMLYEHCNMKLISNHSAKDVYNRYSKKIKYLNGQSIPDSDTFTKDEREVVDTYGYAIFQRQTSNNMNNIK